MKAIDVVLLPAENISNESIAINQQLDNGSGMQQIPLGTKCLPHISLAMGGLKDEDTDSFFKEVAAITSQFSALNLNYTAIECHPNDKGEAISGIAIEENVELQKRFPADNIRRRNTFEYGVMPWGRIQFKWLRWGNCRCLRVPK